MTEPSAASPDSPVREELQVIPFSGSGEEWDSLLTRFEGSTFCHLWAWRTVMSEALGHEPMYRIASDRGGAIHGLLPMVRVRSRLFGDFLVSMPFLSYGGPLGTEEARSLLAAEAAREAQDLGVDLLELRSRTRLAGSLAVSERRLTVLLDLPGTAEELWDQGLRAKVRSQVRRPMKEGMEAAIGPSERAGFYEVFSRTMRDLGTPVLPIRFFDALARELSDQAVFCTVSLKGEPVAAGCGFLWGGEFEITWAGAIREFNRLSPNMLLYWSMMETAIERGAHTFNFGRCSPDSGTHRFKKQWGGRDHILPWAQWSKGKLDATPAPTERKYQIATLVWRRLPVGVTNRLGPLIARNLP